MPFRFTRHLKGLLVMFNYNITNGKNNLSYYFLDVKFFYVVVDHNYNVFYFGKGLKWSLKKNLFFLKLDILEKKNFTDENDKHFGVIDCIDKNNNPVRFFVFNSELLESVINAKFKRLQNVNVCFVLNYNSQRRNWNVNLKSIA